MNKALQFPPALPCRRAATLILALLTLLSHPVWAATYNAGPGQTFTNLGSVPWGALEPGDTVNIHYQPGGYHEVILLSRSGASGAPITINGVPDPVTGALPVIDGQNSVAATNIAWRSSSQFTEGVVVVGLSATAQRLAGQSAVLPWYRGGIRDALVLPSHPHGIAHPHRRRQPGRGIGSGFADRPHALPGHRVRQRPRRHRRSLPVAVLSRKLERRFIKRPGIDGGCAGHFCPLATVALPMGRAAVWGCRCARRT